MMIIVMKMMIVNTIRKVCAQIYVSTHGHDDEDDGDGGGNGADTRSSRPIQHAAIWVMEGHQ